MHATPPTRTAKNCKSMVMVWSCPAFTDGWFLGLMVYDLASSAPCQTRERGNERPRRSERPGEARRASAAQSRNDDRNPCGTAAMLCLLSSRASVVRHFDPNVANKIPRTVDLTPGTADFGATMPYSSTRSPIRWVAFSHSTSGAAQSRSRIRRRYVIWAR